MFVDELDAYLVTRYEDVHRILKDLETFSSELEFGTGSFAPSTPAKEEAMARGGYRGCRPLDSPIPRAPARPRRGPAGVLPRRVRQLEGLVQELCDEIIDGLDPGG